jgi:hypothetical protein
MNAIAERKQSLWDIESQWRELAEARFEAECIADPAEREAAIVANNEAIARCAAAELQKADGIIHFRETFSALLDANKRQQGRLKAREESLKSLLARVDSATLAAMEAVGKKKVLGSDGAYLLAKGNGGLQPLIIETPELLPDECCRMEGWISAELWQYMRELHEGTVPYGPRIDGNASLKRVPDNGAIRAKLLEPCPTCDGKGFQDVFDVTTAPCEACGGSGKNAVPGAYLGERGAHLEVR